MQPVGFICRLHSTNSLFPDLYTMNRRTHADLLSLMRPMYHVSPSAWTLTG